MLTEGSSVCKAALTVRACVLDTRPWLHMYSSMRTQYIVVCRQIYRSIRTHVALAADKFVGHEAVAAKEKKSRGGK